MTTNFSRRTLLKLTASTLLTYGLWPGTLGAADAPTTPFRFAVLNDLHLIDAKCAPYFEKLVATLNAATPNPDLLLIVGDLVDNGTAAQYALLRPIFDKLKFPFHAVPGNHDYATPTDRQPYENAFPKSLNYTFDFHGWQFLALDSTDGQKYDQTAILQPTLDYLDQTLPTLDRNRPLILFTHFPLGTGVKYRPTNAEALLQRLLPFNLRHIFDGHYHAFTENKFHDAPITTNRCCSFRRNNHDNTKEKGFFICAAADNTLTRNFVEFQFAPTSQPASQPAPATRNSPLPAPREILRPGYSDRGPRLAMSSILPHDTLPLPRIA